MPQVARGKILPSGHRIKVWMLEEGEFAGRYVYSILSVNGKQTLALGNDTYAYPWDAMSAAKQAWTRTRGKLLDLDPPKERVQQPKWRGPDLDPNGLTKFESDGGG